MQVRLRLVFALFVIGACLGTGWSALPARAAEPGEFLIDSSGTLQANQTFPVSFYSGGAANIRLQVDGGQPGDAVRVSVQGAEGASWTARTGEIVWGTATLPAQNGSLLIENVSGRILQYSLKAYALDVAPRFGEGVAALAGVSQSGGSQSTAQITAPTSGLYRFTLGAASGSYQLRVDNGVIVKTVASGATPSADDTVYFLNSGVHTLTVVQSAAASTEWSIALAPVGGADVLPYAEQSAQLGGGGFFAEERVPIQVNAEQAVNIRVAVTGGANDSLSVELYNGAEKVYTSSPVFGGEIAWGSAKVTAGANAVRVVARDGNSAALAYAIQVVAVAQAPATWQGVSYGNAQHASDGRSQIQLMFPAEGLYRFTLGATAGRYQLLLNNTYLQKTVTTAGVEFSAYVPAGAQSLQVVQDPAAPQTAWSVAVAPSDQKQDVLPFTTRSATLGGTNNAFREEWIPVQVAAGATVNARIAVSGAAGDALQVEIYNGDSKVYTAANVYGGEVFWGSAVLAQGKNLIRIVAPERNSGQMAYELTLNAVASMPTGWNGVSRGAGLQSAISVNAPVSGTYLVTVTVESGAGQVKIDPGQAQTRSMATNGTTSVLRVPLTAGLHTFVFQQDAALEATTWSIATSLRKADPVQPGSGTGGTNGAKRVYIPIVRR